MRTKLVIALALAVVLPAQVLAATDYYLKLDGVEGESTTAAPAPTTTRVAPTSVEDDSRPPTASDDDAMSGTVTTTPQEGSSDAFIKFGGVEGETTKGRAQEGESAADDSGEKDVAAPEQGLTPDFSILLGGGGGSEEEAQARRDRVADILLKGAQEAGAPVEQVSLNFEKITTKVRRGVKLFGFIPVTAVADVDIDAEKRVSVRFPWWAFLASGKDAQGLGQMILDTLTGVMRQSDALTDGLLIIR